MPVDAEAQLGLMGQNCEQLGSSNGWHVGQSSSLPERGSSVPA